MATAARAAALSVSHSTAPHARPPPRTQLALVVRLLAISRMLSVTVSAPVRLVTGAMPSGARACEVRVRVQWQAQHSGGGGRFGRSGRPSTHSLLLRVALKVVAVPQPAQERAGQGTEAVAVAVAERSVWRWRLRSKVPPERRSECLIAPPPLADVHKECGSHALGQDCFQAQPAILEAGAQAPSVGLPHGGSGGGGTGGKMAVPEGSKGLDGQVCTALPAPPFGRLH